MKGNRKRDNRGEQQGNEQDENYEPEFTAGGADGERIHFEQIEEMAQQVFGMVKEYIGQVDKKTLLRYVSVATLVIFGMRKNSFLGKLVVTAAVGMVSRYIIEAILSGELNDDIASA